MSNKTLNINVVIADRPYRLKINPEEEEMVRKAAKSINEKMKEFQSSFSSKDKQDFLAMIALQNTVDGLKGGGVSNVEDVVMNEKLEILEELLSSF